MSHRSLRSTLVPVASGLAAVIAVSWLAGVLGAVPAYASADHGVAGTGVQGQEWWLAGLHVRQAWQTTEGAGITVAVLSTGVAAGHPDLAGSVSTGPDFTGSGRTAGEPFWGIDGTEVAGVIAGHGHGTGGESGMLGVAPAAKILSIRVNLEYNDPLNSDPAVARRLPAAIADGITYAVDHGARVIDLPLDPATAGLTGQGDPVAAGGNQAEQAAVAYALRKNVVLVAPAGDDALGPGLVNYPAAYPGVIAVGAVARDGQLAPFSSRHSYVSLTAPGVDLMAAVPPDDYARISSTSTSSGIVAGVAALILSRFPHLTVAQVTLALTGGTTTDRADAAGAGHGTVDAARAVEEAAAITSAAQPRRPASPSARPHTPGRLPITTAADRTSASTLAGSLVRYVVAGLCGLIVLLVVLTLLMRSRRERARAAAAQAGSPRVRSRGLHEQRRPESGLTAGPGGAPGRARCRRPGRPGPAWPGRARPGPAGTDDHERLARRGGLAGRQRGRDRALLQRAVPPDHDAGAEARQDGQDGREPVRTAMGARAGTRAHDRAAPGGGEQRPPAGSGPRHPGARRHGGVARRGTRLAAARALRLGGVAGGGLPAAARGRQ